MTLAGMVAEYGRFLVASFVHSADSPRFDVTVIANPPDFLLLAGLPQRVRGSQLLLDVHDLMTDLFAVRLGVAPRDVKYRLVQRAERAFLRLADHVITVHEPYADEIVRRTKGKVAPIVVMNSADDALFSARSAQPSGSCVFCYHGSLFERYGVVDLLSAFRMLRGEIDDAQLWFVGDGDSRSVLVSEAKRLGLADAVWVSDGMLPAEDIRELLPRAHVGVVPNQPNELNKYALSTKLFEYVATGVPVACAGLPTLRRYFADDELLFFRPGSVDDLAEKLLWAARNPADMTERARRASAHYTADYSWPNQKAVFLELLESCLRRSVNR